MTLIRSMTLIALCALGMGLLPDTAAGEVSNEIPSRRPSPGNADIAIATAREARKTGGVAAEGNKLLEAFSTASGGDKETLALELARFAPTRADIKQSLMERTSTPELVALVKKTGEMKDLWRQRTFVDEYLGRSGSAKGEEEPEIVFTAGRVHMVVGPDEKKALELFDQAAERYPNGVDGKRARIYAEAIRGPQSIAALDANYDIAFHQSRVVRDPFRAIFSHWRALEAADREFFHDFLASPSVSTKDKAEILYRMIFHAYNAADYERVPAFAGQAFTVIGYEGRIAEKCVMAVGMSYQRRAMHHEGAESFSEFLRLYPNSSDAPRASLYLAQCLEAANAYPDALTVFGITAGSYPNTPSGKEAQIGYNALLRRDLSGEWLAKAEAGKDVLQARLKQPANPQEVFAAVPLPTAPPGKTVADVALQPALTDSKTTLTAEATIAEPLLRLAQTLPESARF